VDLHASIFPKNRMYLYKSSHTNSYEIATF